MQVTLSFTNSLKTRMSMMEPTILKHQDTAGWLHLVRIAFIHYIILQSLIQAIASIITMLPGFTFGALLAYLAMALPQLEEPNATGILITLHEASWLCRFQ